MSTNHYEEYAVIDAEIKALTAKKDAIKEIILDEMVSGGEDKIDTGVGKFSITKLKKWTYPDEVLSIEDQFKAAKAKAESTGEATYVETNSLRFTGVKL